MTVGGRQAGARIEIRALTGLRGAAAAYVVAFHFTANGQTVRAALRPLAAHGYLAVDVFFVLSGYVLALTYGAGFASGFRPAAVGTFLARRIARVYPTYLVATLACAALAATDLAQQGPPTAWALLTNLAMAQAWGLSQSLDYPGWSISAEFAAYLLFPLLALAALGGRATRCWTLAAVAAAVLWALATKSTAGLHETGHRIGPLDIWSAETLYPVLRCLGGFTLGVCAWRLSGTGALRAAAEHRGTGLLLAVAAVGLLLLPGTDLAFVLLCGALVPALARGRSLPSRLLAARPIHWLGVVSYSLYLVHYPVRWALGDGTRAMLESLGAPRPGAVSSILLVAVSLGLAAMTYAWIERPGRDLVRLIVARRQAGAASKRASQPAGGPNRL